MPSDPPRYYPILPSMIVVIPPLTLAVMITYATRNDVQKLIPT